MTSFRNKLTKCFFNDIGYCKFQESCRKEHFLGICYQRNCERNCHKRHPILCKYQNKCKFYEKNVCAFKHEVCAQKELNGENLELQNEIKELKQIMKEANVKNETEINKLNDKLMM